MLKNFQQPRIITPRQDSNAPTRRLDAEGVREFQIQDLGAELGSRAQVGAKFSSEHDGVALSPMQTGHANAIGLRGVGEPGSHCSLHTMRYRKICSTNHNFLKDGLRYGDLAKKVAQ